MSDNINIQTTRERVSKQYRYNILTLYAPALLEQYDQNKEFKVSYDLKNPSTIRRSLFRSLDQFEDCALFYQLRKVLDRRDIQPTKDPRNRLLEYLIFVDFDKLFLNANENGEIESQTQLAEMFDLKKGIKIIFASGEKTFVPYDKSGSMSRSSRISFIDRNLWEELDQRLCLDIDFKQLRLMGKTALKPTPALKLSKYYAYRGLYLSTGQRIQRDDFELSAKTVIIIPDDKHVVYLKANTETFYQETKESKERRKDQNTDYIFDFGIDNDSKKLEGVNGFDGEGLISPAYAEIISEEVCRNKRLDQADGRNRVSSMQIRMPFVKGMLHSVDFHEFFDSKLEDLHEDRRKTVKEARDNLQNKIREKLIDYNKNEVLAHSRIDRMEFPAVDMESFEIIDAFGIRRKLKDAQIILTESMFKCKKWLEDWVRYNISEEEQEKYDKDPMRYYFEKVNASYDHTLYVTGTNLGYSQNNRTTLNYQFLNTLQLTGEELEELVNQHFEYAEKSLTDLTKARGLLLREKHPMDIDASDIEEKSVTGEEENDSIDESEEDGFDDEALNQDSARKTALRLNPAFLQEKSMQKRLQTEERRLLKDCAEGRLNVAGTTRYLSGDLMRLLLHLRKQGEDYRTLQNGKTPKKKKEIFETGTDLEIFIQGMEDHACLFRGKIFVPQIPYELLCVSTKSEADAGKEEKLAILRNPHLSRSEDRCAVPYSGALYNAYFSHLNGVVMTAYNDLIPMALSGADFDGDPVKVIFDPIVNRAVAKSSGKYPIGIIPDLSEKEEQVPDTITYKIIKRTFSNQIGRISNLAVKLSRAEYRGSNGLNFTSDPKKNNEDSKKYRDKCCEANIVTGLEIDSAKTGIKPTKNIIELQDLEKGVRDGGKEKYYFDRLKDIRALNPTRSFPKIRLLNDPQAENREYRFTVSGGKKITRFAADASVVNIDRLPGLFAEKAAEGITKKTDDIKKEALTLFKFEKETEDWKNSIPEEVYYETSLLVRAYYNVVQKATRIAQYRNRFNAARFDGRFLTILKMQYDDIYSGKMPGSDTDKRVCDIRDDTYSMLYDRIERGYNADDAKKTEKAIRIILKRIVDEQWIYTEGKENRETKLRSFLNIGSEEELAKEEKAAFQMLTNFKESGYGLLYYALKDIAASCIADDNTVAENYYAQDKESNNKYCEPLYKIYKTSDGNLIPLIDIKEKLLEEVGKTLFIICNNDWDLALKAVYRFYREDRDKRSDVLYRAIAPEAFERNIYRPEKGDSAPC